MPDLRPSADSHASTARSAPSIRPGSAADRRGRTSNAGHPTASAISDRTTAASSTATPLGRRSTDRPIDRSRPTAREPDDRLGQFAPAILVIRWSTTMVSLALAASAFVNPDWAVIPWVIGIVCNTVIRTISPLEYRSSNRSMTSIVVEILFHLVAVAATGFWESPLTFSLIAAVTIAAFARGFGHGLRLASAAALLVSLPQLWNNSWTSDHFIISAQWSTVVMLVAVIAGYARRISWEATQRQEIALDRLSRLADANTLLFSLNQVAQLLPASLDSGEVLDSTMQRLQGLVPFESALILTVDDADGSWVVARKRSARVSARLDLEDLPAGARRAAESVETVSIPEMSEQSERFNPTSSSAVYIPLLARGSLIGLLAVEGSEPNSFDQRDVDLLNAFVEPAALAIDNAKLFSRLRTVGADEERTRIARDLHDRIGQSLAYLAFELDRILNRDEANGVVRDMLEHLRADLRTVVGEVRDTLYDLRTDVDADKDFATTIADFSERVSERSDLKITLDCEKVDRLPILQEREMWRIAQEALINVERHADASQVTIRWSCNGISALLEVTDDGRGFPEGQSGRVDSYGILGMRERAASIGAALELISNPGEGTKIRCSLAQG